MTKQEAINFLSNTKVYVKDKSEEIQKKLFEIGFAWDDAEPNQKVQYIDRPFIFIYDNRQLTHSTDVKWFYDNQKREITVDDILGITIEPTYRPFKTQEECWNEMLRHEPFGWITLKIGNHPESKAFVIKLTENCFYFIGDGNCVTHNLYDYEFDKHFWTFADGTPFGIKEE